MIFFNGVHGITCQIPYPYSLKIRFYGHNDRTGFELLFINIQNVLQRPGTLLSYFNVILHDANTIICLSTRDIFKIF